MSISSSPAPSQRATSVPPFARPLTLAIAVVLTVAGLAFGGLFAMEKLNASSSAADSDQDKAAAALMVAADQAYRAIYTEQQDYIQQINAGPPPNFVLTLEYLNKFKDAAAAVDSGKLKLPEGESGTQLQDMLADPAAEIQKARDEVLTGHVPDAEGVVTYDTLRDAFKAFASGSQTMFTNPLVRTEAEKYANAINSQAAPTRIDRPIPEGDAADSALAAMTTQAASAPEKQSKTNIWFLLIGAGAGALAVIAWIVFALVASKTPKAEKAPKPAKATAAAVEPASPGAKRFPGLARPAAAPKPRPEPGVPVPATAVPGAQAAQAAQAAPPATSPAPIRQTPRPAFIATTSAAPSVAAAGLAQSPAPAQAQSPAPAQAQSPAPATPAAGAQPVQPATPSDTPTATPPAAPATGQTARPRVPWRTTDK
ncbi:MAG: hypothetical protein LBR27_01000 [Bifidobacteriaceae bacterium]|jgi:flagellar basal body-associated protein FliL|nr:hypothetical protein [Bifidobacteriaceae bacterium]